ncbi:uncharacterized protein LOC142923449, partial [Petromyzon marinus]|uniref:uncharacterized protein LOC142923449 n=1 Tax=Petromyzon marinus TaxID=7757 RepID=UPI003F715B75
MHQAMQRQLQQRLVQEELEATWERRRQRIAVHKMQAQFKRGVVAERMVVKSLDEVCEVSTFRVVLNSTSSCTSSQPPTADGDAADDAADDADDHHHSPANTNSKPQVTCAADAGGDPGEAPLGGPRLGGRRRPQRLAERRRDRAQQREKDWEQLMLSRPQEGVDDPVEEASISLARSSMGDLQLKSCTEEWVSRVSATLTLLTPNNNNNNDSPAHKREQLHQLEQAVSGWSPCSRVVNRRVEALATMRQQLEELSGEDLGVGELSGDGEGGELSGEGGGELSDLQKELRQADLIRAEIRKQRIIKERESLRELFCREFRLCRSQLLCGAVPRLALASLRRVSLGQELALLGHLQQGQLQLQHSREQRQQQGRGAQVGGGE